MPSLPPDQATVDRHRVPGVDRLPARLFGLPVVAALLWVPEAVWAATPDGTAGGGAEIPAPSLLEQLLAIIVPIAGIVGILVIVIRLALVIARLGRPAAVRQPVAGSSPTGADRPPRREVVLIFIGIGAALVGGLVGREIARENSVYALFGGAIPTFFLVVTIGALVLIGLLALAVRHGDLSFPISTMLVAAGTLAAGAVGGNVTARATGGTSIAPVVLEAPGTMTLVMPGGVQFVAGTDASARCASTPDGRTVADVVGRDLGELGPGTLRGTISLPGQVSDEASASFFIDAGDLPDGSSQPSWSGPARISDLGLAGTSGKLTFSILGRDPDPALKPGSSAPPASAGAFPDALSGTITWACQPW
jgi:hypothetical protein